MDSQDRLVQRLDQAAVIAAVTDGNMADAIKALDKQLAVAHGQEVLPLLLDKAACQAALGLYRKAGKVSARAEEAYATAYPITMAGAVRRTLMLCCSKIPGTFRPCWARPATTRPFTSPRCCIRQAP